MSKIVKTKVLPIEGFLSRVVLPISTVSVFLGFLQAWVKTFYFNDPYNQRIGWIAQDGNWPSQFAFGVHYFGDYLVMNQLALNPEPWINGSNYPPVAMVIFRIFAFFPYHFSLYLWLFFAIICVASPLVHATKELSSGIRIQVVFLVGLLSAPVIGTLDRGNNIFLLVPLLYFGFYALTEKRNVVASLLLGLACAIKLYPFLIVLFLVLKRKWIVSTLTTLVMISSSILTALYWGNPLSNIKGALKGAAAYDGIDANGQQMVFSFVGQLNNFLVFAGFKGSALSNSIVESPRLYGIIFLAVIIIVSLGVSDLQTYLLATITIQLVPTVSYTYTRIWTVIAVALLLRFHSEVFDLQKPKNMKTYYLWWAAIIGTNTLISVWILRPMSLISELSLIALLAIVFRSYDFKLIVSGFKSIFADLKHVFKINLKSYKPERF
jgi:hypothetical protein